MKEQLNLITSKIEATEEYPIEVLESVEAAKRTISAIYRRRAVNENKPYDYYNSQFDDDFYRTRGKLMRIVDAFLMNSNELSLPEGKKQKTALLGSFAKQIMGIDDSEFTIYIGSCPDYSYDINSSRYTHQNLGEDIPLLTQLHTDALRKFIPILNQQGINFNVMVLIADVEATDEVFAKKFSNGKQEEFIEKCNRSMEASQKLFQKEFGQTVKSSSFFTEFGQNRFMLLQQSYQDKLTKLCRENPGFLDRVMLETQMRENLYRQMYTDQFEILPGDELRQFLIERSIRTMAQYLTLGELVRQKPSAVISHRTVNFGLYNEQSLMNNPDSSPLPVLILNKAVY